MLKPGDTFAHYTIEALIGQGGMGHVYRAHDTRLDRRVALKVISGKVTGPSLDVGRGSAFAAPDADARLLREARAAAALDHPNAVAIFDVGEMEGTPYIVMELVSGRTLRSAVGDAGVPVSTRLAWLADAARAIAAAHRRGLVHRDIKPENVMVRDDGVVKVLDFGIARRAVGVDPHASTQSPALPTLTIEGVKLGTPIYMAPEQIRGEALDGRADQFAWGVLAYELLTGRLPWRGADDAFAVVASILTDEVDTAALDGAGVPPAVQDVVLRALAKRPVDRHASMDDAARALDAALKGEGSPARAAPARGVTGPADPAPGVTAAQRFSTQELRDVLARAVDQQAAKDGAGKFGFEDLLAVAREVGVDEETLREVSRERRARSVEPEERLEIAAKRDVWLRRKRRAFYRHFGVFVIVNLAMLVLGFLVGGLPWTLIPGLCWAVGLGIHGLHALTADEDDWAKADERMRWRRDQQRRRHELALARARGDRAPALPEKRAALQVRIETAPEEPRPGARVSDTARERAAEEEAALEEDRALKRRQR